MSEQQQRDLNPTGYTIDPIQPKRVLIVEDDDVNRWLASRLLEQKGYVISTATNGEAALAILKHESFDLILMDIQMPVMDGLSATRAIRHQERHTRIHVPIIALTSETGTPQVQRYWQAGMDSYLAKPIHTSEFYRIIEAVLQLHARLLDASPLPSTFEAQEALRRLNYNVELLQQLGERFFNTAPHLLSAMRRAIAKDDPYNLDFAAHRLRGAASNLSAHAMVELAERLELIGSVRNMAQAEMTLTTLEQELDRFQAAFASAMKTIQTQFNS